MRWTLLLLGLCIVLAGCSGSDPRNPASKQTTTTLPSDETSLPPEKTLTESNLNRSTPTSTQPDTIATATSIPTTPSTPTSTQTTTSTETPTPESTATQPSEPETQEVYSEIGEWTEVTVDGETDMRVRINDYMIRDEIETDDDTLDAPDGEQWVVVNTTVRTLPGDEVQLGYTQWRLLTVGPQKPQPDDAAMRRADYRDMLPDETMHGKNDAEQYRIIFATDYTDSMTFVMQPFGSQEHPTLVFEA